jgi:hypothetical protein
MGHFFDGVDLRTAHAVLTFLGVICSVFVMQSVEQLTEHGEPVLLAWCRRLLLTLLSLALLWSLAYSQVKQWQPWPPDVAVIAATDAIMVLWAVTIRLRIRRWGGEWKRHKYRIEHL